MTTDERQTHGKRGARRAAWFIGIYLASVLTIGAVAWAIRLWIT